MEKQKQKTENQDQINAYNKNNFILAKLDTDRYHDSIHVTPDFTEITNGHYLVRCNSLKLDSENYPIPGIREHFRPDQVTTLEKNGDGKTAYLISKDQALELQKNIRKNDDFENQIMIACQNGKYPDIVRKNSRGKQAAETFGETYPDSEAIMEAQEKREYDMTFHVNPEYLEKLARVFREAGCRNVKISADSKDMSAPVKFEGTAKTEYKWGDIHLEDQDQSIVALLMKMKVD